MTKCPLVKSNSRNQVTVTWSRIGYPRKHGAPAAAIHRDIHRRAGTGRVKRCAPRSLGRVGWRGFRGWRHRALRRNRLAVEEMECRLAVVEVGSDTLLLPEAGDLDPEAVSREPGLLERGSERASLERHSSLGLELPATDEGPVHA